MANDLFREMVSIARDYFHPFKAENLIRSWCEKCGTNEEEVTIHHLPSIILIIATDNKLYDKLKFHEYLEIMKRFVAFSNQLEEKDIGSIKEFVREQKDMKKKGEIS